MLKWAIQRGFVVIPGTGKPEHMLSNLAVYDAEVLPQRQPSPSPSPSPSP